MLSELLMFDVIRIIRHVKNLFAKTIVNQLLVMVVATVDTLQIHLVMMAAMMADLAADRRVTATVIEIKVTVFQGTQARSQIQMKIVTQIVLRDFLVRA